MVAKQSSHGTLSSKTSIEKRTSVTVFQPRLGDGRRTRMCIGITKTSGTKTKEAAVMQLKGGDKSLERSR